MSAPELDPILTAMETLQWDHRRRLDTWMINCLGAPNTAYTRLVSRHFILGMTARRMFPGCRFDYLPVLQGDQGVGKSRLLMLLASPYAINDPAEITAHPWAWLVELTAMESLRTVEIARLKAFISAREDRYRPPYSSVVTRVPRKFIAAGTSNGDDFLERRFWPVQVKKFDHEQLVDIRNQLFAEARHWLRSSDDGRQCPNRAEEDVLARRTGRVV